MLNLIKLVIDRAIERILSLVSVEDVKEIAIDRLACTAGDDLVDGLVEHPHMERVFSDITSRAVARHIDLSDLAGEIDLTDLAEEIDAADVAGNIDYERLALVLDLGDFAESIDYDRLADAVYSRVCVPEIDGLEDRINEATSQAVANALDAANRRTEPVAPVVEQSPDLVARLLDLAVEKLLARADEAAKNGEV